MQVATNTLFPGFNFGSVGLPDPVAGVVNAGLGTPASTGSSASPGDTNEPYLDYSGVPSLDQVGNACGTTSLAMVLMFLTGKPYSQADIDHAVRRVNSFGTAPTDLKKFAEGQGLEVGMYNHSSIDDIKGQLAQGHPVMCSLNDPYNKGNSDIIDVKDHYVTVTGFKEINGKEYVEIRDPNTASAAAGTPWDDATLDKQVHSAGDYLMPVDTFKDKWGPNTDDGYDNFMMVYAPGGTQLPADNLNGVEASIAVAQTFWNEANNWDRMTDPDNVGSFAHGVTGFVGGAVPFVMSLIGWVIETAGQGLKDKAENWPPVFKQLGMATGDLLDIPGRILTQLGQGFSNAADDIGSAWDDLGSGHIADAAGDVVNAVGDAATGVVDAVGGAISDVGDAIGDLFDW